MTASTPHADGETFLPLDTTPEEWETYLAELDYGQKVTVARQGAFLKAFADVGSIRSAAPGAGITRQAVHLWIQHDQYHFRSRFEQAILQFREQLQDLAIGRVKVQKPNDNPLLLVTLLNAHWPERYRRDTVVMGAEGVKEMLAELRRLVTQEKTKPVIEGQVVSAEAQVDKMLTSGTPGRTGG